MSWSVKYRWSFTLIDVTMCFLIGGMVFWLVTGFDDVIEGQSFRFRNEVHDHNTDHAQKSVYKSSQRPVVWYQAVLKYKRDGVSIQPGTLTLSGGAALQNLGGKWCLRAPKARDFWGCLRFPNGSEFHVPVSNHPQTDSSPHPLSTKILLNISHESRDPSFRNLGSTYPPSPQTLRGSATADEVPKNLCE